MEVSIEKRVMHIIKSRKRQRKEGIELQNQEKIITPREKENYQNLGIFEADTIKQAET